MHTATLHEWGYDGSALSIDTATGAVVGTWVPTPGQADPRLDFQTPAELCRACGRVLLTSGSKFSIWFCDECRSRVRDLNARMGRCVVPLGRHTLCNGIGTKPARAWDQPDVERFVDDLRGVWESMVVLERWTNEIVRRNCRVLGLDAQPAVALSAYLDAVRDDGIPKAEAFALMVEWWSEQ